MDRCTTDIVGRASEGSRRGGGGKDDAFKTQNFIVERVQRGTGGIDGEKEISSIKGIGLERNFYSMHCHSISAYRWEREKRARGR